MTRILIVDDEPDVVEVCVTYLRHRGEHEIVEGVFNTRAAEQYLHDHPVDVMALDVYMPGEDGISFLARIREQYPNLKVIIFTSYPAIETMMMAQTLGAVEYLMKPFSPSELADVIAKCEMRPSGVYEYTIYPDQQCLAVAASGVLTEQSMFDALHNLESDPDWQPGWRIFHDLTRVEDIRVDYEKMKNITANTRMVGIVRGSPMAIVAPKDKPHVIGFAHMWSSLIGPNADQTIITVFDHDEALEWLGVEDRSAIGY